VAEFAELTKVIGALDAVLVICIVMVWREWRKAEARIFELLQAQIAMTSDTASKYSAFEGAIRGLTEVIKKG
jgi:hypothetical protein